MLAMVAAAEGGEAVSDITMRAIWWASVGDVVWGPYYNQTAAWEAIRLAKGGEHYPFAPGSHVWCSLRNERAEFAEHVQKKERKP